MARYTATPNMISPCEQWSIDDLERAEDLENQIEELNTELERLDEAWMIADDSLDTATCALLEERIRPLTDLLDALQYELDHLGED
jgi:chromosome segregation ATPase